jgi:ADP-dependent NAD(P)H-hydrate dehydratase / NAD(P)H-hydrate epimerase
MSQKGNASYWHKQTLQEALYPELLWSKPENKAQAGKILIVGGNALNFSAIAECYNEVMKAGAGTVRLLFPDKLKTTIKPLLPDAEFAPSTKSGGLALKALDSLLEHAAWADAVIFPGDIGKNSETIILLEKMAQKYNGPLGYARDACDWLSNTPDEIVNRSDTILALSTAHLQKLAKNLNHPKAITYSMNLNQLVEELHKITAKNKITVITMHAEKLVVALNGEVSTTETRQTATKPAKWRIKAISHATVWSVQNINKKFPAITTGLFESEK